MSLQADTMLDYLRAAGESTRLRILRLLAEGELAVGELVQVLGQSQPRLSHHLKILSGAELIERLPEGAWVFYRWPMAGPARRFLEGLFDQLDMTGADFERDLKQLSRVRLARRTAAEAHFDAIAGTWDKIRALHSPNEAIEQEILALVSGRRFTHMVDIGTGTGRMLTLFSPFVERAEGIDFSHDMLTVARANLDAAGLSNGHVRHGEASATPFDDNSIDLVTIHHVLHFLDAPEKVISEASRILRPGGQLIVVDFAPHDLEFLRTEHGHRRLGIREDRLSAWADGEKITLDRPRRLPAPADSGLSVLVWSGTKIGLKQEHAA